MSFNEPNKRELRQETIEEIGEYLDSLNDTKLHNICRRITLLDLIELQVALRKMKEDCIEHAYKQALEENP